MYAVFIIQTASVSHIMKTHLFFLLLMSVATSFAQTTTEFTPPSSGKWYRLVSRYSGQDKRTNTCIQYSSSGTQTDGSLYAAAQITEGEPGTYRQLWQFKEDPSNPGQYALICRAAPDGYLSDIPVQDGVAISSTDQLGHTCRWRYITTASDNPTDKYGFVIMTNDDLAGVDSSGNSYAGISTVFLINLAANDMNKPIYMNCGGERVNYAINLWSQDYDENANEWILVPVESDKPGAIEESSADDPDRPVIYNLQGIRIYKPSKGIYIINGRKVLMQ